MSNLPHLFQQGIPYFSSQYSIIFIAITLPLLFSLFCAVAISKIGHRLALIDNPGIRDVGSIFLCMIMFLCTFYADAVITLYYRWKRGENLMQAHRSHLYQYLSNELKVPHWKVTLLYAVVQLCFGAIAVAAYQRGLVIQLILFLTFSIVFLVGYNLVKAMKPRLSGQ